MPIARKFPAAAVVLALAATPAMAGAASVTTTPTHPRIGQSVRMLVKGMKPGEKVKAYEVAPNHQTRTLYPRKRVNAQGVLLVTITATVKGKHTWTFTGRTSRRRATTYYVVVK